MKVVLQAVSAKHREEPFVSVVRDKTQTRMKCPTGNKLRGGQRNHRLDESRLPLRRCAFMPYRGSDALPEGTRGYSAAPEIIPYMIAKEAPDVVFV